MARTGGSTVLALGVVLGLGGTAGAEGTTAAEGTEMKLEHKVPRRQRPADAPADAWLAVPMDAETSADSYCAQNLERARKADPATKNTCGPFAHKAAMRLAGPWKAASAVQLDEHTSGYVPLTQYVELVVSYDGKWFRHRIGHVPHPASGETVHGVALKRVMVKDVIPGGAPELLVESSERVERPKTGSWPGVETTEYLDVCSVGKSGVPSCVRATIAEHVVSTLSPQGNRKLRLGYSFDKTGRLVVRAKAPWPKKIAKRDYEARVPLYFP